MLWRFRSGRNELLTACNMPTAARWQECREQISGSANSRLSAWKSAARQSASKQSWNNHLRGQQRRKCKWQRVSTSGFVSTTSSNDTPLALAAGQQEPRNVRGLFTRRLVPIPRWRLVP